VTKTFASFLLNAKQRAPRSYRPNVTEQQGARKIGASPQQLFSSVGGQLVDRL
jgi:hypothetical protein